jgi:hypothetical protein
VEEMMHHYFLLEDQQYIKYGGVNRGRLYGKICRWSELAAKQGVA